MLNQRVEFCHFYSDKGVNNKRRTGGAKRELRP